jgi:ubiquinone/menaquinone biosynthesis C-methylase UbiE
MSPGGTAARCNIAETAIDDIPERKTLLRAARIGSGRALDVGMGDCACMSLLLAAEGFEVTGIDRSSRAVHEARKDAVKRSLKGSFVARRANAEQMPFADEEFDVVLAYRSLHHANGGVERVIHEMHRVCKPGGDLLIAEYNEQGRREFEPPSDGGNLSRRIEVALRGLTCSVRRIELKHYTLFVSHKRNVAHSQ